MDTLFSIGKYVLVQETEGGNYPGLGSRQIKINKENQWLNILNLLETAKEPVTLDLLQQQDQLSDGPGILNFLLKENFIVKSSPRVMSSRYNRTFYYYQSIGLDINTTHEKLLNSAVTILGCGGIGNHISAALASNGVGTINLVDGDHIEISNLTRQILFDEQSIGKRKVEVLAKRLRERNSACNIHRYDINIENESDLEKLPKSDLIVLSADSDYILETVNQYCVKNSIAYINVCYMNDIAVWGPFYIPGETGCHACGCHRLQLNDSKKNTNKAIIDNINQGFKSATFPPVNATASALATSDIIRFLAGSKRVSSRNKRIGLHDFTLKVEEQDFSKNTHCNLCNDQR